MKRWHKILLAVLVVAVVVVLVRALAPDKPDARYVFTEVVRTDLHATVSSTGTLSAVETVEIGTQVSGQVLQVLVDYNDVVEAGQLLAIIDPEALDAALENAQAGVIQAEGQRDQAQAQLIEAEAHLADARATLERNEPLAKQGYLSQSEIQPLQTAVQTAEASVGRAKASLRAAEAQVAQAKAQVARALKDRRNAEIRAPISGIIVERSVDAGQTVAASFNTPTLFILAKNLEQMQILADVDESDIGQIRQGQAVTFTVPAYPDQKYQGTVREVRLQPSTEQNVVTYTVVVDAANTAGNLLPGMTATVDFVTGEVTDVLAVSTAALQLQPTPEMWAALMREGAVPPGAPARPAAMQEGGPDARPAPPAGGGPMSPMSRLWYVDEAGQLHTVPVRTGLSTGALTAIEPATPEAAALLQPGLRVIEQVITNTIPSFNRGGPPPPM